MKNASNKINFTKLALSELPAPDKGRVVYYDSKQQGLQLRVSASGAKSFSFYKRIKGGEPERVTLGQFPDVTVEQARRQAAQMSAAIAEGKNPAAVRRSIRGEPTLSEFFTDYGERYGSKKKSWADEQQRFRDYLQPGLGKRRLSLISRQDIAKVLADADKAGKAGSTVNHIRALASVIFKKAIEWGLLEANPATGLPMRKTVKRDRFLQGSELPQFFEALEQESNTTMRDYILLALLTGARRSNLLAMRWADINLPERTWRIPVTKNGDPQNVVLSVEAVAILEGRQQAGGEWVFPSSTSEAGHITEPKDAIKRILERAGIPVGRKNEGGVTLHDLRRTLGSWQAKTGASLVVIGKSLNHKSQQATAIYARLDVDPVRESVEKATAAMLSSAGLKETAQVLPIKTKKTAG